MSATTGASEAASLGRDGWEMDAPTDVLDPPFGWQQVTCRGHSRNGCWEDYPTEKASQIAQSQQGAPRPFVLMWSPPPSGGCGWLLLNPTRRVRVPTTRSPRWSLGIGSHCPQLANRARRESCREGRSDPSGTTGSPPTQVVMAGLPGCWSNPRIPRVAGARVGLGYGSPCIRPKSWSA